MPTSYMTSPTPRKGTESAAMARHFATEEIKGLSAAFVEKLDQARDIAGVPFIIRSGKRSQAENISAQGVENSAHLRGLAVDLSCPNSDWRFKIVRGLLQAGFTRIGIYDQHLHVDDDKSLPQSMMWWGKSH